ncbi:hypothetical protein QFC19_008571 [Naganishia cerealis]|uniref:Uncharacterized protein n=1 Tax=Naganishia cerealis TaxID=610337 RepID=A0ACC2V1G7_9TREE|nr:hypothetical protein QFC19_008571 [Naganishia cerealis]
MYSSLAHKSTLPEKPLSTIPVSLFQKCADSIMNLTRQMITIGLYVDIACWCLLCILALAMGFHLKHLNRKQEQRRIALGRPAQVKDSSVMSLEEAREYKEELKLALLAEGKDVHDLNLDAFDDLTDRENPDFFYVSNVYLCRNQVER